MPLQNFVRICLKLYGFYLIVFLVHMLPSAIEGATFLGVKASGYFPFVQFCFILSLVLALLLATRKLSRLLTGKLGSALIEADFIRSRAFVFCLLVLVGFYLIQIALPPAYKMLFAFVHGFSISESSLSVMNTQLLIVGAGFLIIFSSRFTIGLFGVHKK